MNHDIILSKKIRNNPYIYQYGIMYAQKFCVAIQKGWDLTAGTDKWENE
jgi:hypothetical protein